MIFCGGTKKKKEESEEKVKKKERKKKSHIAAGSKIRKVWMIRICQHTQRAALLTASATSLVWPSSSMPPLLTAK